MRELPKVNNIQTLVSMIPQPEGSLPNTNSDFLFLKVCVGLRRGSLLESPHSRTGLLSLEDHIPDFLCSPADDRAQANVGKQLKQSGRSGEFSCGAAETSAKACTCVEARYWPGNVHHTLGSKGYILSTDKFPTSSYYLQFITLFFSITFFSVDLILVSACQNNGHD